MRTIFSLKSFFRFLIRNKLFTAVNVFGFAISLMFVVLLGLYIQEETSINASQPNKDRIYRLTNENSAHFATPIAADLKNRYPEIVATMRTDYQWPSISKGTREASGGMLLTDSTFLTMFEIPFVEGSPANAMRTKDDILLSEKCARQLFGEEMALGEVVEISGREMVVSGVFRDLEHTHFVTPAVISRFENLPLYVTTHNGESILSSYNQSGYGTYVMTNPNVALTQGKLDEMRDFLKGYYWMYKTEHVKELLAEPLDQVYYSEKHLQGMNLNDKTFLTVLGFTALLILLFAVINYINLSVAQSGFRAKEAAVRRLLGGSKAGLFAGFILESLIVAFISLCLGIMFADLAGPWFQEVMWTDISVGSGFTLTNIAIALGGVLVIGVVAGLMPAAVLTQFKPIDVVRGTFRRQTKMVFSKVLITFQYAITIVLLIATITILRQLDFMKNSDLGFNKDNVLVMDYSLGENMSQEGLRSALSSISGVNSVGFTRGTPATYSSNNTVLVNGNSVSFQIMSMDSVAFNMMDFTVSHSTGIESSSSACWLNRVAWNVLELEDDATEFKLYEGSEKSDKIAGAIEDYHIETMDQPIGATLVYESSPVEGPWNVMVKISGTNQYEVADRVKKAYSDYNNDRWFSAKFMDEHIQERYAKQDRMSWIISVMAMLAVLISALGMLAMATYFARQKAQEVAVRKVFGATGTEVLSLMMMNFLKLVLLAFVIAVPIGWYFMSEWLSAYIYRIDLSWTIFAIAGLSAMLVASGTVLWQALRAVRANPVKAIKD